MPNIEELKRTTDRFRKLANEYPNDSFYSEYTEVLSNIINLFSKGPSELGDKDIHKKYFYCVNCGAEFSSLGIPTKCLKCKSYNILKMLIYEK